MAKYFKKDGKQVAQACTQVAQGFGNMVLHRLFGYYKLLSNLFMRESFLPVKLVNKLAVLWKVVRRAPPACLSVPRSRRMLSLQAVLFYRSGN